MQNDCVVIDNKSELSVLSNKLMRSLQVGEE